MSKEVLRSSQFAAADAVPETELELAPEQMQELQELYAGVLDPFKPGSLIIGKIIAVDSHGVMVDIAYKSDGLIPRYEFSAHEIKKFKSGDEIEVILDELENVAGNVILSYEKAKALKAWKVITELFEENKPVEGIVSHKVKGGLSVDIGIPAFLPGSQVDIQRVTNFDQFVGQTIIANIIKLNQKRGNVIISRRKYLTDQRSEQRKEVLETLEKNATLQGMVKNITNYGVFIDIGGVDGLLHITDMTWGRIGHPSEIVNIGDTITVKVLDFDKENEKISLGLKQLSDNPWEALTKDINIGTRVKGKISSITDYGLFVEVEKGVEGLVHISEISWTDRITDLSRIYKVSDEIEVLVVSLDKENRRMSLSVKQMQKNPWESLSDQFKVGQKINGTISNITDFGIFVQLIPGIDGLVHISDLSWTEHIEHPSDLYKKGQDVEAVILSIDASSKKISLGVKQLSTDPWENIEKEYPAGKIVDGEVSKITNFGAFIKLPTGIEGLVHISELSTQNVDKVEDVLKVGQKSQFRVIKVSKEDRKLGLSLKLEGPTHPVAEKAPTRKAASKTVSRPDSAKASTGRPTTKSAFQLELEKHQEKTAKKAAAKKAKDSE